uniref:Osteopetrosis-associated transmembrane protein 1 n=1 Tax=Ixodes scapularis TaxID=6945 RepID=A0A4D5RN18_IXOSC
MITMTATNIAATTMCIVILALVTTSSHASFANGSALISDKPNWSRMIDVREHSESLLGSEDAPWENCTLLLVTIANVTSVFERCALMRARPFTMCESCVNEYGVAVRIFDQLQKNLTDPTMKLCKDEFFSSAKFSVVYKTIVHIRDLWQSASCDGCFEKQLSSDGGYMVSNDTIIFNRKLHEMNECVNRSESESKNRTNLCIICDGPYRDLNRFYNGLVRASKDGNICFDMVDAMNATHMLWSSHLCSVHQYSNTPSFIVAGVVGLLVMLFYAGAGLVINPLNTELVPPKRLFRGRMRYGSSSTSHQAPKPTQS